MKKQVITFRQLQKILYPYTAQDPDKSGISPGAHSEKLCDPGSDLEVLIKKISRILSADNHVPDYLKAIIELMVLNGLRISEVLSISGKDISKIGHIKISGAKGSFDRWVTPGIYKDWWISKRNRDEKLSGLYSRYHIYREFKKMGVQISRIDGVNMSVTHSLRHLVVSEQQNTSRDIEVTARFIGHKTSKSTHHYDNKTKKKGPKE